MELKATTKKSLVLGIDGMDPRLTNKLIADGRMPNTKKLIELGSCREDLVMLGGHPTVTPPMWTTLATGAYACTHGIQGFTGFSWDDPSFCTYNLDSRRCKAEQLWNVSAEAGLKTLVWHWPGSSWPPSSDSENLHVVDGTQPAAVNMGVGQVEPEFVLLARPEIEQPIFREKAASDANVACVITDLKLDEEKEEKEDFGGKFFDPNGFVSLILEPMDGQGAMTNEPYNVVLSPIRDASGWDNAPADAKEFVMLFAEGRVRRVAQILKNEEGIYDHVAIYKNKKAAEPIAILNKGEFTPSVVDESLDKNDEKITVNRNMRILELSDDGLHVKMWVSAAMKIGVDSVWHPKRLYKDICENIAYPPPECLTGAADRALIVDCMLENWEYTANWQADVLHYLIENEKYDMIFSHFHNLDALGHMMVKYLKTRENSPFPEEEYQEFFALGYEQTDRYIGRFLHLLDEGWTIYVVSDHAQVSPEFAPPMLNDSGVSVRVMQELGLTELKKDENGNDLYEIDWTKTKAIANHNHIIVNDTGRFPERGIVKPEDKYMVEEEIMTKLYGYRDKTTGMRVVSLALRNRDAYLIGMGGPECGDIVIFNAEGYTFDHADSLATTYGYAGTSVSPIFIAAGAGIKKGFKTDRIIREVDLTPTMAVLAGLRMPAQCEGAPIYQIMEVQ